MGLTKLSFASILFVFASALSINTTFAQSIYKEYIVIDSAYLEGNVKPLGNDKIRFYTSNKNESVIYSAQEIKEYGSGGNVYESLLIKGEKRFYKRVVAGENTLYKDKGQYFLKYDNELIYLNSGDYRSILQKHLNYEGIDPSLSKLSYSEVALRNFLRACNEGACDPDNFPHRKLGLMASYNILHFNTVNFDLDGISRSMSVGLFGELPLFSPRSLYITTALHLVKTQAYLYKEIQDHTNYLGIDVLGFTAPLGVKWLVAQGWVNPYLKAGALVSYLKVNSPTGYIETVADGSSISIFKQDVSESQNFLYGVNAAVGIELPYKNRKNFHLELKYLKLVNSSFNSFNMNLSGIYITSGFNL